MVLGSSVTATIKLASSGATSMSQTGKDAPARARLLLILSDHEYPASVDLNKPVFGVVLSVLIT